MVPVTQEVAVTREVPVTREVEVTRKVPVTQEVRVVPVTQEVEVTRVVTIPQEGQVTREVPVTRVVEVIREVEVIKEVAVTQEVEVTREVPVTRVVEIIREVEVIKEVPVPQQVNATRTVTDVVASPTPRPTLSTNLQIYGQEEGRVFASCSLQEGKTGFTINHWGDGDFVVSLQDTNRKEVRLADASGDYFASKALVVSKNPSDLQPGPCFVIVDADGRWEVEIRR